MYVYMYTHTQIYLCEFLARPPLLLPTHTHHLVAIRMNVITRPLYPHSCHHRKLRPPRLNPHGSARTSFPAHLHSLPIPDTFPLKSGP